jgi:hypothetical protein
MQGGRAEKSTMAEQKLNKKCKVVGQKNQGALKNKVTDPCVYLVNFRGTNQPLNITFLPKTKLVRFWAFRGEGSSKTRLKKKMQKVHVKNFFRQNSQKIDNNFDVTFPRLLLLYRVFRCFLAMGVHKHYKKRFTKNRVEKFLQKIDKKIPNRFFLDIVYHVFGRFGAPKHDKKIAKI